MNWWTLRATCLISWLQFEYALYWPSSLYSLNWTTLHRLYSSVQMIRHNRWPAVVTGIIFSLHFIPPTCGWTSMSIMKGVVTSLTSESWRKRRSWRSWRCQYQPLLNWILGNCWESSVLSLWGKQALWPHLERSPADLWGRGTKNAHNANQRAQRCLLRNSSHLRRNSSHSFLFYFILFLDHK